MAASAISLLVIMGVFSMIGDMRNETRSLEEKLAALNLEGSLIRTFQDLGICTNILTQPTPWEFNSTLIGSATPPVYNLTSIPSTSLVGAAALIEVGKSASPLSSSLIISKIQLTRITGSGNNYSGEFVIDFDTTKTIRSIKPLSFQMNFFTDPTTPVSAKKVLGCQPTSSEMKIGGLFQYYMQCGNKNGPCANANGSWKCGTLPFSSACNNACRHPNPLTGECSCPLGYTETNYFDFAATCGSFYSDNSVPMPTSGTCGVIGNICSKSN